MYLTGNATFYMPHDDLWVVFCCGVFWLGFSFGSILTHVLIMICCDPCMFYTEQLPNQMPLKQVCTDD